MANNQPHQIIDEHKIFHKQSLETVVKTLGNCSKNYFTIAIIGAQSTGKSTLLNHLFKTNFKVLKGGEDGKRGERTTRGVIAARDSTQMLLIMDVEGNDSYESHIEGDENYQKMVSSFALVGANVLLVNIFQKQLGQHSGSQYETLSIVMRICIDQFKQESPKTILFCLRDANPDYTDQGQCRRKIQTDVLNIWKSVWAGTKKSADFQKYQSTPERFFSIQVAFLREYDADYPEDFTEDVAKLRDRFINQRNDGYLFKKQKKQYNLPIEDICSLLSNVWDRLSSSKELNLPNQKIQLANYRCEEYSTQLTRQFQKNLEEHANDVRNFNEFLTKIQASFEEKTKSYHKSITQKWLNDLLQKFKPKIRKIAYEIVEKKQVQLEQKFVNELDNLFFDLEHPKENFKEQSKKVILTIVQELSQVYRIISYEISERKERIEAFRKKLQKNVELQVQKRLKELKTEMNDYIQRQMRLLVAAGIKENFGMEFYGVLTNLYLAKRIQIFQNYNKQLSWIRGHGASANQLDDSELFMVQSLKSETKKQFEVNLLEKLVLYFKERFYYDQHKVKYDYISLNDQKTVELFSEAKQMVFALIKVLNNFRLQPQRRSSMIFADDIEDESTMKPLLESSIILSIQQQLQKKAADQYASIVRKRNQTHMKQVPTYLFVLIFFFIYDDIWFSYDQYPIIHTLMIAVFSCIAMVYAVGQGVIMRQIFQIFYEIIVKGLKTGKEKFDVLRGSKDSSKLKEPQKNE